MYQATAESLDASRFVATTRHSSFVMDTRGRGANPVDTLLAALCGCVGHYATDYLHEKGIAAALTVRAEATATEDQSRLARIAVRIDLGAIRLGGTREAELIGFVQRCKVLGTLRPGCPIEIAFQRDAAAAA